MIQTLNTYIHTHLIRNKPEAHLHRYIWKNKNKIPEPSTEKLFHGEYEDPNKSLKRQLLNPLSSSDSQNNSHIIGLSQVLDNGTFLAKSVKQNFLRRKYNVKITKIYSLYSTMISTYTQTPEARESEFVNFISNNPRIRLPMKLMLLDWKQENLNPHFNKQFIEDVVYYQTIPSIMEYK